jgi:uncharacterized protein (UPF0261 family)
MAIVVLVGTLDTKGEEYGWLRDRLLRLGVEVVLIDAGVIGEPLVRADIPRDAWPRQRAPTWDCSGRRGTAALP